MNPTIVIFDFRIASRKPFIHLDFVIDVMGIEDKFCTKTKTLY